VTLTAPLRELLGKATALPWEEGDLINDFLRGRLWLDDKKFILAVVNLAEPLLDVVDAAAALEKAEDLDALDAAVAALRSALDREGLR
jgi:hypothetical protein